MEPLVNSIATVSANVNHAILIELLAGAHYSLHIQISRRIYNAQLCPLSLIKEP